MFDLLESHFWLLCGLWVGGLGALQFHAQLGKHVKAGTLTAPERSQFVRGWFVAIMSMCTIFWLLQLAAGPSARPDYFGWPSHLKWLATVVNVFLWALFLWWIFAKQGAEYLSRLLLLGARPWQKVFYGPSSIKAFALLMILAGIFGMTESLLRNEAG